MPRGFDPLPSGSARLLPAQQKCGIFLPGRRFHFLTQVGKKLVHEKFAVTSWIFHADRPLVRQAQAEVGRPRRLDVLYSQDGEIVEYGRQRICT